MRNKIVSLRAAKESVVIHADHLLRSHQDYYDLDLIERALAEADNHFGNLIQK